MTQPFVSNDELEMLRRLSLEGSPAPWRSFVEGRDHFSGDDFIMVSERDARSADIYVSRDGMPADAEDFDLIATARTFLPRLLDEIERLRATSSN
jgi:hypothetical protein